MSKLLHFSFESGAQDTLTKGDAMYVKVDIYHDDMSATWYASPIASLAALDFSSARTGSPFVFNVPKLSLVSNAEPGVAGNSSIGMEAFNVWVGTSGVDVASGALVVGQTFKNVGYTKVTYNGTDYVTGQYFTVVSGTLTYTTVGTGTVERLYNLYELITVDWESVAVYIRISTKSTSGGTYVVRYLGIVNQQSIELDIKKASDPESWLVKFDADDNLQMLTRKSAAEWMSVDLLHADYDYTATNNYLTFVGDFPWGGSTFYAGRYYLNQVWIKNTDGDNGQWLDVSGASNWIRYIKLVEIFQGISDFLGYEGTVNDGGAWADFHSWKFYYNTNNSTGTGGETLTGVGIDGLYVISGFYNGSNYIEDYGFFDDKNDVSPHSWKTAGDALEVLSRICESLGCTYRTRVNASGQRYLEVIEYAKMGTTVTLSSLDNVISIKQKPNAIANSGITVVSTGPVSGGQEGSNVIWGSDGTDSLKYDCFFLCTNNLRANYDFQEEAKKGVDVSGARATNVRLIDTDFLCSLYALTDITAKAATNAYSICLFQPLSNGAGAAAEYPGSDPDFGQFDAGFTPDGYVFPKRDAGVYYTFIEAPAMALAYYLFNKVSESTDPVGFSRPAGDEVEVEVVGVDYDAINYPPFKLALTINNTVTNYLITEVEEDIAGDVIKYIGHTREA